MDPPPTVGDAMREQSNLREVETEREEQRPDQPTELPRRAWPGVLKRTLREYKADNLGDLAAALTYYGVLAIFRC
jgi:membrane protein